MSPVPRRLRVELSGAVQGVGFRPFVYRLATGLGLSGWVLNGTSGVVAEVEGDEPSLREFLRRVSEDAPPRARIREVRESWLAAEDTGTDEKPGRFSIRTSDPGGDRRAFVLPDVATCPDCLREVLDPLDRRHGYPFANCTNCGPRFTIVRALPYDRPNTTMAGFDLCPACRREYEDPLDRRFHAQPTACAACGPTLSFLDAEGREGCRGGDALRAAAAAVREGRVVAVKGLGGFHLLVDATSEEAVAVLRRKKAREEKPFALMAESLASVRTFCRVNPEEEALLLSPEAPIVLLDRLADPRALIAPSVAPGNPALGVMLPSTPLHHLLLAAIGRPVVATSGNRSEEPICTDEAEAVRRLSGMADHYLVHDRPIERHADDSIARVVLGEPRLLRRARGFAPLPVRLGAGIAPVLAVGGHLKNTVAVGIGSEAFVSQHLGDLETPESVAAFEKVIADFLRLYEVSPSAVAHDLHPGYVSTRWAAEWARSRGIPLVGVQHHHAHLASCLAENGFEGPALGVTWDGTGWGTDGTVWGGEFLLGDASSFARVAHLRTFRLPGGEAAVREPRRAAFALLREVLGTSASERDDLAPVASFSRHERDLLSRMLETGLNSPVTSSAGRLFDAVSALAGIRQATRHEGQAAMELEWAADLAETGAYPLPLLERGAGGTLVLDWEPLLHALLQDLWCGASRGAVSARFHNALVDGIAAVAKRVGCGAVALSGGCFLNRLLLERTASRLREDGFDVLLHREVPPGDGGISLGQVAVAVAGARRP